MQSFAFAVVVECAVVAEHIREGGSNFEMTAMCRVHTIMISNK